MPVQPLRDMAKVAFQMFVSKKIFRVLFTVYDRGWIQYPPGRTRFEQMF